MGPPCEPQEPLRDAAFPFPPLQRITSHIHVRHGMSLHHVLRTASLEILKIKNVANHKYLKSPGAGICTVFKQRFLIWYLCFLQQQHASCKAFFVCLFVCEFFVFLFFLPFRFSVNGQFHIALAQQKENITNSICPAAQEGRFSLSWPLCHLFLLFFLSGFCLSVWWSDGMRNGSVARSPSASARNSSKMRFPFAGHSGGAEWSALSQRLQPLHCWATLPQGPSDGYGNLFPVFNPRDSGGGVVEEAVLSSAIAQINGNKWCMLQHDSKHCLSLSCSWTAWEDWQMFQGRVDSHFPEYSLTNAGNVIRLSPMFCASALISTLLSVEENSQEQHQKKSPLASKWALPGGRKNIFLPLTYNEREETNQSFAMK